MELTRPETLDAVVLSHLHFDHMSDLLPMQYALQFSARERPLPVFLPRRPERVRALLECPYYDLFDHEDIAVGEMQLRFIPAVHPVEGSCVAVEGDGAKFVFTGDTNLDPALELLKKNRISIGLKAIVTPYNVGWTLVELYQELVKEREKIK